MTTRFRKIRLLESTPIAERCEGSQFSNQTRHWRSWPNGGEAGQGLHEAAGSESQRRRKEILRTRAISSRTEPKAAIQASNPTNAPTRPRSSASLHTPAYGKFFLNILNVLSALALLACRIARIAMARLGSRLQNLDTTPGLSVGQGVGIGRDGFASGPCATTVGFY